MGHNASAVRQMAATILLYHEESVRSMVPRSLARLKAVLIMPSVEAFARDMGLIFNTGSVLLKAVRAMPSMGEYA